MERERLVQPGSEHRDAKGRFKPGNPGKPPDTRPRVPYSVKRAVAEALEQRGGKDGMVGFFKQLPANTLAQLAGKLIPSEVEISASQAVPEKRDRSFEEVALSLHQNGMSSGYMHHLADQIAIWGDPHAMPLNSAAPPRRMNGNGST